MDKNVALIAEQVGLLLAPTLRGIVSSLIADPLKRVEDSVQGLRTAHATHAARLEAFEKRTEAQERSAPLSELVSLTETVLMVRSATEQQVSAVKDTLRDAQAEHASKLQEVTLAAETERKSLRSEIEAVRGIVEQLSGVVVPQQIAALKDALGDLRSEHTLSISTALSPLVSKQAELEASVLSASAAHAKDIEALQASSASLHEKLVAYSGTADKLGEVESQLSEAIRSGISLVEEQVAKLQASLSALEVSVEKLRDAEPKTVTIKSELDPEIVEAAVAEAVKSLQVPAPDMDALAVEARSAATEVATEMLPVLRESLSKNIHDEVHRAVAALPPAKDGEPGPPGLMHTVEPYIEGVVYERLSLVSHAGGAWQATRRTKAAPAAASPDWQAIAAGVSSVSVRATDTLRNVELVTALSDGTEVKSTVAIPVMIYRDVYDPEKEYTYADVTTYAGSLWFALKDTSGEPPSKSPGAWRLIVKRGQEGKDGKDGKDGVQFQAGFEGEFEENKSYSRNAIVTYAGSIWISKRPTKERPPYLTNADSDHWLRLR